jgi:hypothetical protein
MEPTESDLHMRFHCNTKKHQLKTPVCHVTADSPGPPRRFEAEYIHISKLEFENVLKVRNILRIKEYSKTYFIFKNYVIPEILS